MRFVGLAASGGTRPKDSDTQRVDAFKEICFDRNSSMAKIFHPKLYAPSDCSSYASWSNCWSRECLQTISALWECGTREQSAKTSSNGNASTNQCSPPFRRILHQTRYPLDSIEIFNSTICASEKFKANFFTIVAGFFPYRDWGEMSCLDAVSWYTYDFESTLLRARKDSHLVDGMFPIESTSPCEVASMAGFVEDRSNAVDDATAARLSKICHGPNEDDDKNVIFKSNDKKDGKANSKDIFVPRQSKMTASKVKTSLTWEDMERELGGNRKLVQLLKSLTEQLGYSGQQRNETSEFI
jgi:hypothetical protein